MKPIREINSENWPPVEQKELLEAVHGVSIKPDGRSVRISKGSSEVEVYFKPEYWEDDVVGLYYCADYGGSAATISPQDARDLTSCLQVAAVLGDEVLK